MQAASRDWLRTALTALLTLVLQRLLSRLLKRHKSLADRWKWKAREDLANVQACLLTSVNLHTCGRIEKRTVLSKPLDEIFTNDHVRGLILEAARKTSDKNPFVCSHLRTEDSWHVLVAACNHLSCMCGPHHLFANQVSSYESCWYVFSLIGTCTHGSGRFFITPQHKLSPEDDVGAMRIRIVLVLEQELRKICSGEIREPRELFSERHRARWELMKRFARVFEKQVAMGPTPSMGAAPLSDMLSPLPKSSASPWSPARDDENDGDCNNFLRLHVPIPLLKETHELGPREVVLYE